MVASCWLFLYDLYYDALNHEHQVKDQFGKDAATCCVTDFTKLLFSLKFNVSFGPG